MFNLLIAAMLVVAAAAQDTSPATGSISGVVKDATTGTPLPEMLVAVSRQFKTTTDSQGHYTLRGLPPGSHRVHAASFKHDRLSVVKTVTLGARQDLTAIDFAVKTYGEVSGRVIDEHKEPVPGMMVLLVVQEYRLGALRYLHAGVATTDDQGAYRVQRVTPGRAYLAVAQKSPAKLAAVSDAPAEPKLRKKVFARTYFPGSTFLDGAEPFTLRTGERREGVEVHLTRAPSFCIEGVLETESGPAALDFEIAPQRPTSGWWGGGGFFLSPPHGTTGPDGKIRVCDLPPGDYLVTASQRAVGGDDLPPFFGITPVSITDRDVRNFQCGARPQLPIPGEVAWDGAPPDKAIDEKLSIQLRHLTRGIFRAEYESLGVKSSIPGEFSFPRVLMDEYAVQLSGLPKDLYVKDITYAGASVLRSPLRAGSAIGNATLRITLARDGGVINAKVADKEGHPVPDSYVLIMPAEATTEASLAAALITAQTDQKGTYTTSALAPGKYLVLASTTPIDMSPECITKLFQARIRAQEITLAPNANVTVTLAPTL
jgi:protocatechuate 3,4-dioxygenase beta subunit